MTKFNPSSRALTALALCGVVYASPALAQEKSFSDRIDARAQAILQYVTEEDKDLGTDNLGSESSFSQQLQGSVKAELSEHATAFVNARALNIDGEAGFDDDTGETVSLEQSFLELREFWIQWDHIGIDPVSLQLGRQRVREPRSLWWNSDFDMARVHYDTTLLKGFIGVGEELASYRTDNNGDFEGDDEDRLRTLGELSWQHHYNHFLEGRFLYENDHSGTRPAGTIVAADDRDDEDLDAAWLGVRTTGVFEEPVNALENFKYRADLIGLFGDEDLETSAGGPGTSRTVTGVDNLDVSAWAFDSGFAVSPRIVGNPVFTAGYSYGSGDDDATDGTDNEFRQTDMQGSSSRIGLERQQQKNYGEVLRPELSNIHILTAGVGLPVTEGTDVGLTYFNYHLAEDATSLRSSGIGAPMNGTDKDIGQAADFIVNVDVDKELDMNSRYVDDIGFRLVVGSFFAGDAYEPADEDDAYRVFTELRLRF